MRKMLIILASAAVAAAAPATAAPEGGTGMEPPAATGGQQSGPMNGSRTNDRNASDTDRQFVEQVGSGGEAEVELGRIAEQKAASNAVKEFARHMVRDHSAANRKLTEAAEDAGITPPSKPDSHGQQTINRLGDMRGQDFDKAYMRNQLDAHQQTAQLLEKQINSGQDKRLQRFASETLPVVREHLRNAREIEAQLNDREDSRSSGDEEGRKSKRYEDTYRNNEERGQDSRRRNDDDSYRHNDDTYRHNDDSDRRNDDTRHRDDEQ